MSLLSGWNEASPQAMTSRTAAAVCHGPDFSTATAAPSQPALARLAWSCLVRWSRSHNDAAAADGLACSTPPHRAGDAGKGRHLRRQCCERRPTPAQARILGDAGRPRGDQPAHVLDQFLQDFA